MQALAIYQELLRQDDPDPLYHTYSAACYYYMGLTQQAEETVQQASCARHSSCSCCSRHWPSLVARPAA